METVRWKDFDYLPLSPASPLLPPKATPKRKTPLELMGCGTGVCRKGKQQKSSLSHCCMNFPLFVGHLLLVAHRDREGVTTPSPLILGFELCPALFLTVLILQG